MLTLFNDDSFLEPTIHINGSDSIHQGLDLGLKMEPFDYQAFLESQNIPDLIPPLSPDSESTQDALADSSSSSNAFSVSVSGLPSFHPDTFAMIPFDLSTPQQPSQHSQHSQPSRQQLQHQHQQLVSNLALRRAESHNVARRISSLSSSSSSSPRISPYPITTSTLQMRSSLYPTNQDLSRYIPTSVASASASVSPNQDLSRYIPTPSTITSSSVSPNQDISISTSTSTSPNTNPRSNTSASTSTSVKSQPSTRHHSTGLRRKPTPWSDDEERMLIDAVLGGIKPAWVEISKSLPGHSADNIRKHWSTIVKRMTRRQRGQQPTEDDTNDDE